MIKLSEISTLPPESITRKELEKETDRLVERLGELQELLYAEQKHAVLVIFQGMDASGKDGAVRNVFKDCSFNGINVYSFKKPTEEEFAHDFLWRVHKRAPAKGMIQIFNRSHYEDVLIQRVHNWITEERVDKRIAAINAFEDLLEFDNNTHIFKFYLHLSYDQQKIELQERIDEREKNWKHNANDWKEREHWDEYMRCYEDVINRCDVVPWTIVPVDKRWYRNYIVTKTIVEKLESLNMEFPKLEEE
ncbi:PPK2 family polyphosphate kinase [Flavilitoribacter nigricans]|uniref:Polyphosphate kinase n=1 Tax=Flavilitoribacter nigricans (strain ATCC 23147 / DSM 23189 / NBRC 102662 / NCIMB 1420 / SS-2) TaxID=1122177 RepID=A0A2D0NBR7_FLAN2|nr:PPK2 family polyphosphate kinase [Flavilitoribacter nigricans]PHN05828.1 polyphosphate kinase [Flavilitoribacter nigricans DSM 23189 = NBRC 102662]